ncbi:hypothetical protein IJT17_09950, partial [bacterium]|nr:hypothetical protein [bacterium]
FRFHGVTPRTHLIAAKLMESAHIDTNLVYNWTISFRSRQEQDITRMCADTREYICNGRAVIATLTRDMLDSVGLKDDTEIQNLLHDINNEFKDAFVLIKDIDGKKIRVSLRSQSIPILPIAHKYGGGGHELACAMTFTGTNLASVKELVRKELEAWLAAQ